MATDPQSLLTAAACYQCNGASPYQLELMKLALLAQIAQGLNPAIKVDPQSLLTAASGYAGYASSVFELKLMELALLQIIVAQT